MTSARQSKDIAAARAALPVADEIVAGVQELADELDARLAAFAAENSIKAE